MEKLEVVRSRERFQDDVLYGKAIVRRYGEAERSPAWKRCSSSMQCVDQ